MVSSNGEGDPSEYPIRLQKGLYDLFRVGGFPTLYPADQRPVTVDILEAGWIYATIILAFSLLILLPGLRIVTGVSAFIRVIVGVGVLGMIMICNFGQDWESATIERVTTAYRAGIPYEINASIGVHIGLRSVNITLKGIPRVQMLGDNRLNETIDYNERLSWDNHGWLQGRAGFGPTAGKFNQEFRAHQRKGSPYPILWIAEYFTPDGEGLRWGRMYKQAGYFTHIMVWTALPLWILTLILFKMVIRYGAYCSLMTGGSLLIANIIYASIRNSNQLEIPFPEATLVFHWGWSFWMCMSMGLICSVIGIVVFILDLLQPELVAGFFAVDVTQDMEEFYISPTEGGDGGRKSKIGKSFKKRTVMLSESKSNAVEINLNLRRSRYQVANTAAADAADINGIEMGEGNGNGAPPVPPQPLIQRGYRKRTILGPMQKSRKSQPRPAPAEIQTLTPEATDDNPYEGAINQGYYENGNA